MSSYTTLVHVDAEIAIKISSFISKLLLKDQEIYLEQCQVLIEQKNTLALISKFMTEIDLLLGIESQYDLDGLFHGIFSIIYIINEQCKTKDIVTEILKALTSIQDHIKSKLSLHILVILFNIISEGDLKCDIMIAIFNYAIITKQTKSVIHFTSRLDVWQTSWENVSIENQRILLRVISKLLDIEGLKSQSVQVLIKYFKSYQISNSASSPYPKEVEELITVAVLNAINSSVGDFVDRTTLLESLNTKSLPVSATQLVNLLRIICDGSLQEFKEYMNTHGKVLVPQYKLNEEDLLHKMQLLMICNLAATQSNCMNNDRILSFECIEKALYISSDEVESWVIEAIAERLIEASIDQVTATVTINRYSDLTFGLNHWKLIQQKLKSLRKNVNIVVETIECNKQTTSNTNITMT